MRLKHTDTNVVVESNNPEAHLSQGWVNADEIPKGNASLEVWQEYARSQGLSDSDLAEKTRDDLRDQFSIPA